MKFVIALGQPVHGFEGTLFFAPDNRQATSQLEYDAVEVPEREGLTERCKYAIREIGLESHLVQLQEEARFLVRRIRHNLWRVDKARYVFCGDLTKWTEYTRAEFDSTKYGPPR